MLGVPGGLPLPKKVRGSCSRFIVSRADLPGGGGDPQLRLEMRGDMQRSGGLLFGGSTGTSIIVKSKLEIVPRRPCTSV